MARIILSSVLALTVAGSAQAYVALPMFPAGFTFPIAGSFPIKPKLDIGN